jgi:hypothetical protein
VALSVFSDPSRAPTPEELVAVLGPAAPLWASLVDEVRAMAGELVEAWHFGGAAYGWSLRLSRGGRNLVYLTPREGAFLVGVALGGKAIAVAEAAGTVSPRTGEVIDAAPRYAEGIGVRFEVASAADLGVARELARIKVGR